MVNYKTFSNLQIYNMASKLYEVFKEENAFPVKVNFFLQKNINKIIETAQEIEDERVKIIKKFGEPVSKDSDEYRILPDKKDAAQKELNDLLELPQELPINMIKLSWFDGVEMTSSQVAAISFMIDEEEE